MKKSIITEIIKRIRTASPQLFKAIRWLAGILLVVAAGLLAAFQYGVWDPSFADTLTNVVNVVIPYLASVWGMSFLPVDDAGGTAISGRNTPK